MRGSEFVAAFKNKGVAAWEAAAFQLAKEGSVIAWPMVNLALSIPGHTAILPVASDVFAIGTADDFLRLPLTPKTAQAIANLNGFLFPTPKIVYEMWKAAETQGVQLTPRPIWPHKGANLEDYLKHDRMIWEQLAKLGKAAPVLLKTGHKKHIVISNIYKPGKVLINGWYWPNGMTTPAGFSQPIQARSNIHGDYYADYSHGEQWMGPEMMVDGQPMPTEDVLQDPVLSKLLSDEGPLRVIRYPADNAPLAPGAPRPAGNLAFKVIENVYLRAPNTTSLADQGLAAMVAAKLPKP